MYPPDHPYHTPRRVNPYCPRCGMLIGLSFKPAHMHSDECRQHLFFKSDLELVELLPDEFARGLLRDTLKIAKDGKGPKMRNCSPQHRISAPWILVPLWLATLMRISHRIRFYTLEWTPILREIRQSQTIQTFIEVTALTSVNTNGTFQPDIACEVLYKAGLFRKYKRIVV